MATIVEHVPPAVLRMVMPPCPHSLTAAPRGLWRMFMPIFAFIVMAAACSSTPERIPVPLAEPTEAPTVATETVTSVPPSVTPTAEPTLDDDAPASVTDLGPGEQVVDESGNLVAIHAVRRLPTALSEVAIAALDPATAAIEVSMCTAGAFVEASPGSVDFEMVDALSAPLAGRTPIAMGHALVSPGFVVPDPGACHRGWLPLLEPDPADAQDGVARYVLSTFGDDGLERHVYQWTVPTVTDGTTADGDSAASDGSGETAPFVIGQTVTFNEGPLVGTTVSFEGWAELIDVPAPEGRRMVGVRLEVCPATEDWPELGVAIAGWNLVAPLDPGDRLGADPLAPLTDSCFGDWAEFAVPLGQVPTGFYAGDGLDPVNGFALWTLDGAAINPPG